jgi:hypothetical protein
VQGLALEENNRHSIDLSEHLERDSPKDHDVLAKAYFDCHEYDRCAYLLESRTGSLSIFIRLYAKYIVSMSFLFSMCSDWDLTWFSKKVWREEKGRRSRRNSDSKREHQP